MIERKKKKTRTNGTLYWTRSFHSSVKRLLFVLYTHFFEGDDTKKKVSFFSKINVYCMLSKRYWRKLEQLSNWYLNEKCAQFEKILQRRRERERELEKQVKYEHLHKRVYNYSPKLKKHTRKAAKNAAVWESERAAWLSTRIHIMYVYDWKKVALFFLSLYSASLSFLASILCHSLLYSWWAVTFCIRTFYVKNRDGTREYYCLAKSEKRQSWKKQTTSVQKIEANAAISLPIM